MSNDLIPLPGRQRTPSPVEQEESPASSSPHTSLSAQQSSFVDTSGTSSPDLYDRPGLELSHPIVTTPVSAASSSSPNKLSLNNGFRPAPSFSIARAPRYPGWRPPGEEGSDLSLKGRQSSTATTTTDATPTLSNAPSPHLSNDLQLPIQQRPPRFTPSKPLSPNHLARIANALGVQVPTPISTTGRSVALRSTSAGYERRPASANSNRPVTPKINSATRFLLYVVPPSFLSLDMSDGTRSSSHFQRGALLPLHATLPSQLAAIAREYSLPSTVGLTVYLLDVKADLFGDGETIGEEWLGPRIGDDAWKLLWAGMLRAEREGFDRSIAFSSQHSSSQMLSATSSPLFRLHSQPNLNGSATDPESSSPGASDSSLSPADVSSQTTPGPSGALRPMFASTDVPTTRAGSPHTTESTRTDSRTDSRADSPASSIRTTTTAVSPMLPGLPIVGKIEFDIDRTKATWYESWTMRPRSRTDATTPPFIITPGIKSPIIPFKLSSNPNGSSGHLAPLSLPGSARMTGRRLPPSPLMPIHPNLEVEVEPAQASSQIDSLSIGQRSPSPSTSHFSDILDPVAAGRQSVSSWRQSMEQVPRDSMLLGISREESDVREEVPTLEAPLAEPETGNPTEEANQESENEEFSDAGDDPVVYQKLEGDEDDEDDTSFLDDNDEEDEGIEGEEGEGEGIVISPGFELLEADRIEVGTPVARAVEFSLPGIEPSQIPLPEGSDRSLSPAHTSQSQDEEEVLHGDDNGAIRGQDPLGDVFPSDPDTWSEMREEVEHSSSRSSAHVIHSDRAGFLSEQSSDGSDFAEELPVMSSTADDFQEVLDMLNAKTPSQSPLPTAELMDTSKGGIPLGDFMQPPTSPLEQPEAPPLVLRSPIILDSPPPKGARVSLDSLRSPDSVTSQESSRSRRPAPLILGPMDKIPTILEGLAPTPPVHGHSSPTPSPTNPLTPRQRTNSVSQNSQQSRDSKGSILESVHDEYEDELSMRKELDELERSISSASPRELAPEPLFDDRERSPIDRPSRNRAGHDSSLSVNLNGAGGPRFRSEALSAERASRIASAKGSPQSAVPDSRPDHAFQWPAAPFDRQAPTFTPLVGGSSFADSYPRSSEPISRMRPADEAGMRVASSKYRPPTPVAERGDPMPKDPRAPAPMPTARTSSTGGSRFSADSAASEENGKPGSFMNKSIRKLWRKSGNAVQASVRLSAARQTASRLETSPPPLPRGVTHPTATASGRSDDQNGRPDSGSDPFHFDQQSRQPTTRAASPSAAPGRRPASKDTATLRQLAAGSSNKTRSILKGTRTPPLTSDSSSQPLQIVEEQGQPRVSAPARASLFQRVRANTINRDSTPVLSPQNKETLPPFFQGQQPNLNNIPITSTRPDEEVVLTNEQALRYKRRTPPSASDNLLPIGNSHSSSNFPRTASSRTSFDMEETTFRPSTDSSDPYTPRLSQFEIVSPPGRSFELEEEGLKSGWMR
ncbi:hypothetical protein FRB96_009669 [Tulasnella sp. 330]|nr:hypothetical protein FRB96_009669 [Tulasnella sp. 330]KAG8883302.1 hypothetical protein FRB97_006866 [Tulasnella sp. 331]